MKPGLYRKGIRRKFFLIIWLLFYSIFFLYSQNTPVENRPVFTAEEQDWISHHFMLTVGVQISREPLSSYEPKSGFFSGIQCDFIREIAVLSGLNLIMIPLNGGGPIDTVRNNNCDLVFGVSSEGGIRQNTLINYSSPYRKGNIALCIKKGRVFRKETAYTVAVSAASEELYNRIAVNYPGWTVVSVPEGKLIETVSRGKTDLAAADEYELRYQLQIPRNSNTEILPDYFYSLPLCAAVSVDQNPLLLSVLNKTVETFSAEKEEEILKKNSELFLYQYRFGDIVYLNRYFILVTLTLTSLVLFLGLVLSVRQKKTKKELTAAKSSADAAVNGVNTYLSALSHEIRTPLNAVIEFAELSLRAGNDDVKLFEYNKKILYSSRILLGAVNAVFNLSVSSSYKLPLSRNPFSLKSLASAITKMCYFDCQHKGIDFELYLKNVEDEVVIGDSNLVQQVLVNITANAINFTPEKGKISINFEQRTSKAADKILYRFNVMSDGFKISEDMRSNLFTSFDRGLIPQNADYRETGFVFSIVKYFVDSMKGKIYIKSVAGRNIVFCVELPFYRPVRTEIAQASNSAALLTDFETAGNHFCSLNILLAGVGGKETAACSKLCEAVHVKCAVMNDREETTAELARADLRDNSYNLCVLDYCAGGVETIKLSEIIRSTRLSRQPVILLLTYDSDAMPEKPKCVDYIVKKPLFPSTLFEILRSLQSAERKEVPSYENKPVFDFTGRKILVADDSELNLEILKNLLEAHGAEVVGAKNGKQALDIFSRSAVAEFDFILMDKNMPVLDGLNASALIRKMDRRDAKAIPLFIISADVFSTDSERFPEYGIDGFLSKPVDPLILFKTLAECFIVLEKTRDTQ